MDSDTKLVVLGPPHAAHTMQAQPTLYWAIANACQGDEVEVTLRETFDDPLNAPDPVLDTKVQLTSNGIQALSLAAHKVSLEVGKDYEWALRLVVDPNSPSLDITAQTVLSRVQADAAASKAASLAAADKPAFFAQSGLWYDAVAAIFSLPQDAAAKTLKASLLGQGELPKDIIDMDLVAQ
jgi:hypothetical protein